MSTRSIVAFETESGVVGVYVHSDGYPEGQWGRLETYRKLIDRNGPQKFSATVLSGNQGWSYIELDNDDDNNKLGRGRMVPGYGVAYTDDDSAAYFRPADLADWWGSEYIYLINPETGEMIWAHLPHKAAWDTLEWHAESEVAA